MSVSEFRAARREFRDEACPACSYHEVMLRYSEVKQMDGHDVVSFGDRLDPHLRVECYRCGFKWEMEVCEP